jgi:hypothetical protein
MLDQNTTTVLTTLITVIGTLSGVVLGVILSNRYVSRQEKAKRDTAIIEEVFTLLNKIMANVVDNINNERACNDGTRDDVNRVATLIHLYLPALKENYHTFNILLIQLTAEVYSAQQANNPSKVWEIVHVKFEKLKQNVREITSTLAKLIK